MEPVTVEKGSGYELPACGFTAPEGQIFDGWDKGQPGDIITVTGDTTVTAQWMQQPKKSYPTMLAKMVSTGKKTLVLSWDRNPDADGYDIFFGPCGSQACELLKTVKKGK